MTEQTMERISIYCAEDSDELAEMVRDLDEPGITVGNDGYEVAVTSDELARIEDYVTEHPNLTVERYGTITADEARRLSETYA